MIHNVTVPAQSPFVDYVNYRKFVQPVSTVVSASGSCSNAIPNPTVKDLKPEGLAFVSAEDSPNGRSLLIIGNEISGSPSIYEIVPKH